MATKTVKKTIARKTPVKTGVRRVALVGVNPARKAASKKKSDAERYKVSVQNRNMPNAGWVCYASFRLLPHAEDYARRLHEKNKSVSVKVVDSQS